MLCLCSTLYFVLRPHSENHICDIYATDIDLIGSGCGGGGGGGGGGDSGGGGGDGVLLLR